MMSMRVCRLILIIDLSSIHRDNPAAVFIDALSKCLFLRVHEPLNPC